VRGAEPGDALTVCIEAVSCGATGVMVIRPDVGVLGSRVLEPEVRTLELSDGFALGGDNLRIRLRPMIGVVGVAPSGGPVPTGVPGRHGGNMDTSDITAGSTVCLSVQVPGALLAIGDVHAAMGDGELSGTGIEAAAEVTVRVGLLKQAGEFWPRVTMGDTIATIGSHPDLQQAVRIAAHEMVQLVMRERGIPFSDALMLVGALGDTRVSQLVNAACTARVVMPRDAVLPEGKWMAGTSCAGIVGVGGRKS
jgi:amidase